MALFRYRQEALVKRFLTHLTLALALSFGTPHLVAQPMPDDLGQAARLLGLEGELSSQERAGATSQRYWDGEIVLRERNGNLITCVFHDRSYAQLSIEKDGAVHWIDVYGPAGTYRGGFRVLPGLGLLLQRLIGATSPTLLPDTPSSSPTLEQYISPSGEAEGTANLSHIAYGNETFVAVGSVAHIPRGHILGGVIASSRDSVHWSIQTVLPDLCGVTYAAGTFYAIGTENVRDKQILVRRLLASVDGMTWTRTDKFAGQLDGQVIPLGIGGYTSCNGIITKAISAPRPESAGSEYIAIGSVSAGSFGPFPITRQAIMISADLVTWTILDSDVGKSDVIEAIAYGNGIFLALANSHDGVAGLTFLTASSLKGPWSKHVMGSEYEQKYGVAFGAGRFVAVGYGLGLQKEGSTQFLFSTDGRVWTIVRSSIRGIVSDIAYGNGTFIAVGSDAGIVASADGQRWNVVEAPRRVPLRK